MQENPFSTEFTGALTFDEAAKLWLDTRVVAPREGHISPSYIKASTRKSYNDALKPLISFFGDKPINEVGILHLQMYQGLRSARVCANTVNREVGVLQQVLREFDEWKRLESRYKQLREPPRRAGRTLTGEEELLLRGVAFSKPEWHLAGHCMMVMLSTAMNFAELRQLRRGDVDMERGCVSIRDEANTAYRVRTIPLNSAARESMTWILERWKKLGGCDPEHFILPHRPRRERASHRRKTFPWILNEPMRTIYSTFRRIREAADLPHFGVYDCRVHATTKLLGVGVAQGQHVRRQSDNDRSQRGTGNVICFPVRGGAA
jgi:integrase